MIKVSEGKLDKNILKTIKSIDESFYKDSKLTLDWYLERYKEYHKIILLYNDDAIIGYLLCVPIKKELYEKIISGKLTDDVNVDHNMFIKESLYNYIVSIVIDKNYRNNKYSYKLINYFMNNNLKDNNKYCALTISKIGSKLASKYMKKIIDINDEVSVYELIK